MWNTGDACVDLLSKQRAEAKPDIEHYIHEGVLADPGAFAVHFLHENYSVGGHMETVFQYDPFDETSVAGARKLLAETIDPNGRFGRHGIPMLAGGPDPANLSDWTAHVSTISCAEGEE
jgi:glycolate dehydrogenase FAD-linked subunit